MLKEYFISFILFFAFSIGLAHDVIPHHHHDEVADMKNHHHDSSDKSNHHHDGPLGYFSHISHFVTYSKLESATTQKVSIKVDLSKDTHSYLLVNKIASFDYSLFVIESILETYHYVFRKSEQLYLASNLLRGPPSPFS